MPSNGSTCSTTECQLFIVIPPYSAIHSNAHAPRPASDHEIPIPIRIPAANCVDGLKKPFYKSVFHLANAIGAIINRPYHLQVKLPALQPILTSLATAETVGVHLGFERSGHRSARDKAARLAVPVGRLHFHQPTAAIWISIDGTGLG